MLLAAGALLPLAIFAVAAIDLLVEHERETMKHVSMGRVIAAMSAVDAGLGGAIGALQTLAASENLQTGDLREFHTEAKRALATQPHWRNVGLATPERRQLLDAILPFGANASFGDDSAFDAALDSGRPAVSDIGSGTAVAQLSVRLRVPVVVGGAIRYVLSAPLDPAMFREILAAQQLPPAGSRILSTATADSLPASRTCRRARRRPTISARRSIAGRPAGSVVARGRAPTRSRPMSRRS